MAENWFILNRDFGSILSVFPRKNRKTQSSLNFSQSGPLKFTESDFLGLAPIRRVLNCRRKNYGHEAFSEYRFSQESPRQTKPNKGPKRKVHEFRPFLCEFWCFFQRRTKSTRKRNTPENAGNRPFPESAFSGVLRFRVLFVSPLRGRQRTPENANTPENADSGKRSITCVFGVCCVFGCSLAPANFSLGNNHDSH